MKRFAICSVMLLLLFGCQTQKDVTPDHQPKDPKTWSPVGKTYISDEGWGVYFYSKDSVTIMMKHPINRDYRLEYPSVYYGKSSEWLHFEDTTTLVGGLLHREYGVMRLKQF